MQNILAGCRNYITGARLTLTAASNAYRARREKEQLTEPDLRKRLTDEHAAHPDRRLVLKGDRAIPYGRMRELFAMCKDVGFPGVSLVVGEKTKRGGKAEE